MTKTKKYRLCRIKTVCGRSLAEGVIIVGIASCILASTVFVISTVGLFLLSSQQRLYGSNPVLAINMIIALTFCPMSIYQIAIALALIYQSAKMYGNVFICSLWVTSTVTIMVIFAVLFVMDLVAWFSSKSYLMGVLTFCTLCLYTAVHLYFLVIVNSYRHLIGREGYFI